MLKIIYCRIFKSRLNIVYYFNNKEENRSLFIFIIIFLYGLECFLV